MQLHEDVRVFEEITAKRGDDDSKIDRNGNNSEAATGLETLRKARNFLRASAAFDQMREAFKEFVAEPQNTRSTLIRRWRQETGTNMPLIFFTSSLRPQTHICFDLRRTGGWLSHRVLRNSIMTDFRALDTVSRGHCAIIATDIANVPRRHKMQLEFERWSGRAWDWWPLPAPRPQLAVGKARVSWTYVC